MLGMTAENVETKLKLIVFICSRRRRCRCWRCRCVVANRFRFNEIVLNEYVNDRIWIFTMISQSSF